MRLKAIIKLAKLSNQAPENILGHTIPILASLVADHSSNCSSPSLQGVVVHCLKCINRQGDGRLATEIGKSGALLSILRLLPESDGSFQRLSVQCLWCLVNLGSDDNRAIVTNNGGLEIIVNLLNSSLGSVRRYLLDILSALSMLKEVRRGLVGLVGLHFLVDTASYGNMLSRERACQAIGLLATTRQAQCSLVELGVIPVLVELLRVGDNDTKLVADNALGVISTQIDYLGHVAQAGAIPLLAELLQGPDPLGWDVAENALCLLALNEENAISIADHFVRILKEGNNEAKSEAACVFSLLAYYKHSVLFIRSSGAIPQLVELLWSEDSDMRGTTAGTISQLSYNKADRGAIIETGAINRLIELLHYGSEQVRDNATEAVMILCQDPQYCLETISVDVDLPSLKSLRDSIIRLDGLCNLTNSMRQSSIEHCIVDPNLV